MVKRRITWMRTAVAAVTASRSQPDTPEEDAPGFRPGPGPPERPALGDPERLALERERLEIMRIRATGRVEIGEDELAPEGEADMPELEGGGDVP